MRKATLRKRDQKASRFEGISTLDNQTSDKSGSLRKLGHGLPDFGRDKEVSPDEMKSDYFRSEAADSPNKASDVLEMPRSGKRKYKTRASGKLPVPKPILEKPKIK